MNLNHVTIIVTDLERSVRFYEKLGLTMIVHAPPRYARFSVPEGSSTFSVEVTEAARAMGPEQARIYFECEQLDGLHERLSKEGVEFAQAPTDMDYLWREARLVDPDGHDIRLYRAGENRLFPPWRIGAVIPKDEPGRKGRAGARGIWCAPFRRDRRELLPLFRLGDDSEQQIRANLYLGEIFHAAEGDKVLGYVQISESAGPREFEIRSIAVVPERQRQGIGGKLVRAAVRYCGSLEGRLLRVSTSIGASDAIAFYLKRGFRLSGIIRDAFTAQQGYPPLLDGRIPLNDAVKLELPLDTPLRASKGKK